MKIVWLFQEFSRIFHVFRGCLKVVLFLTVCFKKVTRCSKKVLWVFQEFQGSLSFNGCQGCFKGVSWKFQGGFQRVSKVFQGSFKRMFKVKFHVAWHSAQLPEQKEGLT